MKVALIQEHLAKALLHINKAVSNRPNIPVLANVLLETEKGKLKLSSTNLDIGISTWIGATIAEEGKLTVSAKLLSDFVNSLKSGKLELLQNNQTLVVKSVDNVAEFYTISADDFPRVPEKEGEPTTTVNARELAEAIKKTAFAAGTDESRPVLTGMMFEAVKLRLTLVTVDGFRLSKKQLKLSTSAAEDIKEIVPARSMMEVEKLIADSDDKEDVEIYLLGAKNLLLFKIGDVEFSTRLIEGEFPNYEQILPKENILSATLEKKEVEAMIKVAGIFARNIVGNKAKFAIDAKQKRLTVSTKVADLGGNDSSIDIKELEGNDFETGFNVKFLSDMVSSMVSDEIIFESNGPTAPGLFRDPKDSEYMHVIMPMRLE